MKARIGVWIIAASLLLTMLAVPHIALAAVSVTTAQLQGNQLRVEGTGDRVLHLRALLRHDAWVLVDE